MPYKSQAQAGLFHSPNSPVSPEKVAEFDAASKGKHLPKRVGQKPAALAKGGRLVDHGDHFKLHTKSGAVMTIAHKGLHPSTVKHLQQFAEGGEVPHYNKGRGPGDEEAEQEQDNTGAGVLTPYDLEVRDSQRAEEQAKVNKLVDEAKAKPAPAPASDFPFHQDDKGVWRDSSGAQVSMQDVAKVSGVMADNANDAQRGFARQAPKPQMVDTGQVDMNGNPIMEERTPAPAAGAAGGEGVLKRTADTSNKLGGDGAAAQNPAEAAGAATMATQLGQFLPHQYKQVTEAEKADVAAGKAARLQNVAEQERIAGEAGKAQDAFIAEQTERNKVADEQRAAIEQRRTQLQQDIANNKIDPNHYWKERGTGGRIMASLGLLLSGLGSGLGGGPNMAMQVIQSNIKRDIDAQEKNLDTQKDLLADTYRQTNDLRLWRAEKEHAALVIVQAQMNKLAAQSSSATVKQNALLANAQADLAIHQSERQITDLKTNAIIDAKNLNTQASNAQLLAAAKAKEDAKIPREMQGAKIASMNSSIVKLNDHLQNLQKGWQGPIAGRIATWFPWGGADTKANEAAAQLLRESIASSFGGGVASDARIQAAYASIPGPTDTPAVAAEKIKRLERDLMLMRDEYIAQQGGVGYRLSNRTPVTGPMAPEGNDQ